MEHEMKAGQIEYDGPYPQDETTAWLTLPGQPAGNIMPVRNFRPFLSKDRKVIMYWEDRDDEVREHLYRTIEHLDGRITWQVMVFTADTEVAK